jgi:hypothetical protein
MTAAACPARRWALDGLRSLALFELALAEVGEAGELVGVAGFLAPEQRDAKQQDYATGS